MNLFEGMVDLRLRHWGKDLRRGRENFRGKVVGPGKGSVAEVGYPRGKR